MGKRAHSSSAKSEKDSAAALANAFAAGASATKAAAKPAAKQRKVQPKQAALPKPKDQKPSQAVASRRASVSSTSLKAESKAKAGAVPYAPLTPAKRKELAEESKASFEGAASSSMADSSLESSVEAAEGRVASNLVAAALNLDAKLATTLETEDASVVAHAEDTQQHVSSEDSKSKTAGTPHAKPQHADADSVALSAPPKAQEPQECEAGQTSSARKTIIETPKEEQDEGAVCESQAGGARQPQDVKEDTKEKEREDLEEGKPAGTCQPTSAPETGIETAKEKECETIIEPPKEEQDEGEVCESQAGGARQPEGVKEDTKEKEREDLEEGTPAGTCQPTSAPETGIETAKEKECETIIEHPKEEQDEGEVCESQAGGARQPEGVIVDTKEKEREDLEEGTPAGTCQPTSAPETGIETAKEQEGEAEPAAGCQTSSAQKTIIETPKEEQDEGAVCESQAGGARQPQDVKEDTKEKEREDLEEGKPAGTCQPTSAPETGIETAKEQKGVAASKVIDAWGPIPKSREKQSMNREALRRISSFDSNASTLELGERTPPMEGPKLQPLISEQLDYKVQLQRMLEGQTSAHRSVHFSWAEKHENLEEYNKELVAKSESPVLFSPGLDDSAALLNQFLDFKVWLWARGYEAKEAEPEGDKISISDGEADSLSTDFENDILEAIGSELSEGGPCLLQHTEI